MCTSRCQSQFTFTRALFHIFHSARVSGFMFWASVCSSCLMPALHLISLYICIYDERYLGYESIANTADTTILWNTRENRCYSLEWNTCIILWSFCFIFSSINESAVCQMVEICGKGEVLVRIKQNFRRCGKGLTWARGRGLVVIRSERGAKYLEICANTHNWIANI